MNLAVGVAVTGHSLGRMRLVLQGYPSWAQSLSLQR